MLEGLLSKYLTDECVSLTVVVSLIPPLMHFLLPERNIDCTGFIQLIKLSSDFPALFRRREGGR